MKKILVLLIGLTFTVAGFAKETSNNDSYNMRRAQEEAENGNFEQAIEFYNKELSDNPKNAYAHLALAALKADSKDYSEGLMAVNKGIKLLPKKDKGMLSSAYMLRGNIYLTLGDSIKALDDYNLSLKLDSNNKSSYEKRGQLLFGLGRTDESNADYNKLIELNPADYMGYMGLGRNAKVAEDYTTAIKNFSKVIELEPEYSSGYSFRAECYLKQEKFIQAADDIMKALTIDYDDRAYALMFLFPKEQLPLLVTKLKALSVENPYDGIWPYYIGHLYTFRMKYPEAIAAYNKAFEIDAHPQILEKLSDCYEQAGQYADALETIKQAKQINPNNLNYDVQRAMMLEYLGNYDEAISTWDELIEKTPDFHYAYYRKGFVENNSKRYDEALDDLNMCLLLEPEYIHALLSKGDILMLKGDSVQAMDCYRKIIDVDTIPTDNSCAMYAYLALGEKDKAIEFLNGILELDKSDAGNLYDAACVYARMGDLDTSFKYLKKAVDEGFQKFVLIMTDDDLDALRETEAFKDFYNQHKDQFEPIKVTELIIIDENGNNESNEALPRSGKIEVPFTPEQGCASVKCSINHLPLTFIFDTGASTVSISQLEANFMLKNGYLNRDDIVGTGRFVDANGDVSEGTIINLREVEFGGLRLSNVKASVVRNQKAPLLLGQSVLGRLGKIEIDNPNRKLIITR